MSGTVLHPCPSQEPDLAHVSVDAKALSSGGTPKNWLATSQGGRLKVFSMLWAVRFPLASGSILVISHNWPNEVADCFLFPLDRTSNMLLQDALVRLERALKPKGLSFSDRARRSSCRQSGRDSRVSLSDRPAQDFASSQAPNLTSLRMASTQFADAPLAGIEPSSHPISRPCSRQASHPS